MSPFINFIKYDYQVLIIEFILLILFIGSIILLIKPNLW
jgi:hypothetical protein